MSVILIALPGSPIFSNDEVSFPVYPYNQVFDFTLATSKLPRTKFLTPFPAQDSGLFSNVPTTRFSYFRIRYLRSLFKIRRRNSPRLFEGALLSSSYW